MVEPPWALAVEFQGRPDPDMTARAGIYALGIQLHIPPDNERGSRFQVGAVIVNLTGRGNASRRMTWPGIGVETALVFRERNLEGEPAAELLDGIEAGRWWLCVLPWVPLLAGADDPAVVARWQVLAGTEVDARRRGDDGALARVFADRAGRGQLWRTELENWNVEESEFMNRITAIREQRAEARGEARGREEGAIRTARGSVVRVGTRRFGAAPSADQLTALDAIADLDRLLQLEERIFDISSWSELLPTT